MTIDKTLRKVMQSAFTFQAVAGILASPTLLWSNPANALESFDLGGVAFTPGLEIGAAYFYIPNQAFGSTTSYTGLGVDEDGNRFETYIKPSLEASFAMNELGTLYGKVSVVSGMTRGTTDGAGVTRDNPESTDLDDAYIGWKKNGVIFGEENSAIDFSVGRQVERIGTGFLIGGGHYNQGHEGTYWIAPRLGFDQTAILRADYQHFHADVFHLRTRLEIDVIDHSEDFTLNGFNAEYNWKGVGSVGLTVVDTKDAGGGRREGLNTKSLRGSYIITQALSISGEYATQNGQRDDEDAKGWYANASYTFLDTVWSPTLTYQYAYFGKNYDSLLYGCYTGWGSYCQGEIVGEYMLFNTNETSKMFKLSASPTEQMHVGIVAYDIDFAKKPEGVNSKNFAHEVNVYTDFEIAPNWIFGVMVGFATPGQGAQEEIGASEKSKLLQGYLVYTL